MIEGKKVASITIERYDHVVLSDFETVCEAIKKSIDSSAEYASNFVGVYQKETTDKSVIDIYALSKEKRRLI